MPAREPDLPRTGEQGTIRLPFLRSVLTIAADIATLGWRFALGHVGRKSGARHLRLPVRGIGTLLARPDTSDLDCIRYVFARNPFDLSAIPVADQQLQARYEAILASGQVPVIVDAGANIGASARWFAGRFPRARIAAVEPDEGNLQMLALNCAGLPAIVPVPAAIGSTPGHVSLTDEESWAIRASRAESGPAIVTVDEAVAAAGGGELFVVKINIEGFESDLFAANLDWLDRAHLVLLEPHDWLEPGAGLSRNFQRAMADREFDLFINAAFLVYARRQANEVA